MDPTMNRQYLVNPETDYLTMTEFGVSQEIRDDKVYKTKELKWELGLDFQITRGP